jgi:hypothetical protein
LRRISDDDPDEVQRNGDDDGNDLPSSGRNFPGRFLSAEELFSLGVFRPAEATVSISNAPPDLGFWGRPYTRGGDGRSRPGRRGQAWAYATGGVAPLLLLSLSPSGYLHLLAIYEFLGISLELLIFKNMLP